MILQYWSTLDFWIYAKHQLFSDICLAYPKPVSFLPWSWDIIRVFWEISQNTTMKFFHFLRIYSWPQTTAFHRWVFFGFSSFEQYWRFSISSWAREKKKIRSAFSGGRSFFRYVLHNLRSSVIYVKIIWIALFSILRVATKINIVTELWTESDQWTMSRVNKTKEIFHIEIIYLQYYRSSKGKYIT